MPRGDFSYQYEKFQVARRALMLPHPEGEARSLVIAFHECDHGLRAVDTSQVEEEHDEVRHWLTVIREAMDTDGVEDETGEGTYLAKARQMTNDQKADFADAVDSLTWFFGKRFWGVE